MSRDIGHGASTSVRYAYLVADRTYLTLESAKADLDALAAIRPHALISESEAQLAISVSKEDDEIVSSLVAAGAAILVVAKLHLTAFAESFGQRQFFFRPDSGRLVACQICAPVVLSFFLLHADGALAGHLMRDVHRLVVANEKLEVLEIQANEDRMSGSLLFAQTGAEPDGDLKFPPSSPKDLTWLQTFCPFNSDDEAREGLGQFPHLDEAFLTKLGDFERRLCARKIARAEKKYLLDQGPYPALEDRLVRAATECGYLDELVFPRFVRAFLILGEDFLRSREYFRCGPDQHFSDALASMRFAMDEVGFRIRRIDRFGGNGSGTTP